MKKISEKFNDIIQTISRHKLLSALIMCTVFSFIYIAVNGFSIIGGNDDYCVFTAVLGGNTAVPGLGFFFTSFCAQIQPFFGVINIYMTLQELISFLSLVVINYFILAKLSAKKGLFYTVVFDALFFSFFIVEILFTYTTILAATAGMLCLFYGYLYEKRKRMKILQLILGVFLMVFSSQIRFVPFLICCGIGITFSFGVFISGTAKEKQSVGIKNAFATVMKKYFITGLLFIAVIVSSYGLNVASELIKNSSDDYQELLKYNVALSKVTDIRISPYYYNPDRFEEIGLKSKEDLKTLKEWFVDDDFYTVERLNSMTEIIYEDNYDGLYNKNIIEKTLYPFKEAFSKLIENKLILLYLFVLIIAVFGVVFLSILFPKIKHKLIILLLFAIIWSMYFLISDLFKYESILLILLMAVSLVIILKYDRFQAIITLIIISVLLIPYAYLVSIRFLFYTTLAPIFPSLVLIVFGLNEENAIQIKKWPNLGKIALSVLSIIIAALFVVTGVFVYKNNAVTYDKDSNLILEEYIDSHPETIFLINQITLRRPYYNPFILPDEKPNVVNYGLWLTKAKCFKDPQKKNGINHLFKDTINSNIRIILWEEEPSQGENDINIYAYFLLNYYNNHYTENGEEIDIIRTDRVGKYSLYAVVSKPASANESP